MQDLDDQLPSGKGIVQPEDIINTSTEKCLENVGFEFEKYVDVECDEAGHFPPNYYGPLALADKCCENPRLFLNCWDGILELCPRRHKETD
ncbi:hypothetical protein TNCV_4180321 [Trichonephila clavipes]|nr:hypothetical protein TNCV_4180321 [Trichonephila clavipes]